jgi:hypothetical protein
MTNQWTAGLTSEAAAALAPLGRRRKRIGGKDGEDPPSRCAEG